MANPSSHPHTILTIKNAQVSLDGDRYGGAITSASIAVTQADAEWQPISGEDQYDVEEPQYTLNIDHGQDYTEGSLTHLLMTRAGEQVPFTLETAASTVVATGKCTLKRPSAVLGARGVATATVAMRVNGEPTWTFKPAPTPEP